MEISISMVDHDKHPDHVLLEVDAEQIGEVLKSWGVEESELDSSSASTRMLCFMAGVSVATNILGMLVEFEKIKSESAVGMVLQERDDDT